MTFPLHLNDWRGWLADEALVIVDPRHRISLQPGRSLPAMLRRRLDAAGRATCEILKDLDPEADLPLVHASRHGDTAQTLMMLEALASDTPLSPARFSMSVHNAVLGVHSIAQAHHRPLQALGACGNEFEALLDESYGYLMAGYPAVIAIFSEGPLPAAYQGHTEHPGTACTVGMRLSLSQGQPLMTSAPTQRRQPTPLEVMAWLNGDTAFLDGTSRWQLRQT